jgi:acylphosphatase
MNAGDVTAREVVVHGRVQGVFFRASCQREALARNLTGWVGNEPDGSVRAWFEGPREEVDAMAAWCQDGPPDAVVERVDDEDRQPRGLHGFDVR